LKGCNTDELKEERAMAVGALSARSGHDDVVDVSVVEGAIRRRHAVVTADKRHIQKIANSGSGSRSTRSERAPRVRRHRP